MGTSNENPQNINVNQSTKVTTLITDVEYLKKSVKELKWSNNESKFRMVLKDNAKNRKYAIYFPNFREMQRIENFLKSN